MLKFFTTSIVTIILLTGFFTTANAQDDEKVTELATKLKLDIPKKGFISAHRATRWEESLVTGNGTTGALIRGIPGDEIIVLSHERLFLPLYPPTNTPNIKKYLPEIKKLILEGKGKEAADLALKAGVEAGIEDLIWTDPLVPACQLEVKSLDKSPVRQFGKTVNYETGEATTAWNTEKGTYHQKMFFSRPDQVGVLQISSPDKAKLNFKFKLAQLQLPEA